MSIQTVNDKILSVKNEIINKSLIIGSIIGSLSFITSINFNIQNNYHIFALLDFIVVISFITISFLRKRLPISTKTVVIVLGLLILSLGSVYKVGVFADNKVLLILIPIFAMVGYTFRKSFIIYLFAILGFLVLGYLYCSGIISTAVDLSKRSLSTSAWINNTLLISVVSIIILIIVRKFYNTFISLISDLETKNKELEIYRNKLELLVKLRTKELETANINLKHSNEELETTILKLKNTQANLIQSEKMASLGVLAAGVAHEINNPLNYIMGGIFEIDAVLNEQLEHQKLSRLAPYLKGIKEGIARAAKIVTSLNYYCKKSASHNEICNVHSIIDNCLTMLSNKLGDRIEIIKNYTPELVEITFNSSELHQVILNILSNAEQAISKKGMIKITTKTYANNLNIIIEDNGSGIKSDILSKIADPFFTTKEAGSGTGLGLSIANKIIEDCGGTISYSSKENEGTLVHITIPYLENEVV